MRTGSSDSCATVSRRLVLETQCVVCIEVQKNYFQYQTETEDMSQMSDNWLLESFWIFH